MPSLRHGLVAFALPRLRRSRELDDPALELARVTSDHARRAATPDRLRLPTRVVPRFDRRFSLVEDVTAGFPTWVVTPRHVAPTRTVLYLHGGGFVSPIDPFHVRFVARLARELGVRVVLPDYPLAPEHTWRDSFQQVTDLTARWAEEGDLVLMGDSAGGGYALAVAQALRDRGGRPGDGQASRMVLLAPWVDLTTSTPETPAVSAGDPWLFLGKLQLYAEWWAGSPADLARPEVSPGLASLDGLPPTLMLHGTRDTLMPGCRLLARRAAEAGWDLTSIEEDGLLHVYPLLPGIPEARRATRQVLDFLR